MDPETEFLTSKRQTGNEWELFKENVRPLKRGRNVDLLNHALKAHTNDQLKKSLLENRRFLPKSLFFIFKIISLLFIFDPFSYLGIFFSFLESLGD